MLRTLLALGVVIGSLGGGAGSGSNGTGTSHGGSGASHGSSSGGTPSKGSNGGQKGGGSGGAGAASTSPSSSGPTLVGPQTGGGYTTYQPGQPVALFTVTSPVAPGQPVAYLSESYDTTPGVSILSSAWQGRNASFPRAGVYPVTLTVTDSLGRQASTTVNVLVSATYASTPVGQPSAFFLVTSPVAAGQPVNYVDESYDMTAGETIVNEQWSGRLAVFPSPGTYPVSLRVEDSSGAWSSAFTRDVTVTAGAAVPPVPATPPPATTPGWSATVQPNPASRGQVVTVTAEASRPSARPPTLVVPASLKATWGGLTYARANADGPMAPSRAGTYAYSRTLTIPHNAAFPAGTYTLQVLPPSAQPIILEMVVQSAVHYIEPLIAAS